MSVEGLLMHVLCPLVDLRVFTEKKCALLYHIYVMLVSEVHDTHIVNGLMYVGVLDLNKT